jgi:hypothetical protein
MGETLSFPYVIRHERLELHIAIANIADLHLHEEVVPELLDELVRTVDSDGCLKHPVIVDEGSHVVLDGMHRVAALRRLGCIRCPVCFVDYGNPTITVGCWYRAVKGAGMLGGVVAEVERIGFDVEQVTNIDEESIGVFPVLAAVKNLESDFLIHASFGDLKEAYEIVKAVEEGLKASSFEVLYETEDDALRMLRGGVVDAVLLTPRLTKGCIVSTALSGAVFSYKATRHVVPARPLHVDVPLSLLRGDSGIDEVNEELRRRLERRRLRLVSAGNVFRGRRYEEAVYVFEG